jgi:3-oxoacyl-[acyl-carrier protein] reductase
MVHTEATAFQPQNFLDRVAAMTPLGRIAEPDDVARAIVMYASRDSGFITGTYIPVNGGSSME